MAKQTVEMMAQEIETIARRRASLLGINGLSIKQLPIFRVPKLSSITAHMLTGEVVSLAPTTKEVCEKGGRSGNSKTLNLVTHFHKRLAILGTL